MCALLPLSPCALFKQVSLFIFMKWITSQWTIHQEALSCNSVLLISIMEASTAAKKNEGYNALWKFNQSNQGLISNLKESALAY